MSIRRIGWRVVAAGHGIRDRQAGCIAPGSKAVTFAVLAVDDVVAESPSTYSLYASATGFDSGTDSTLNIINSDGVLQRLLACLARRL